MMEDLSARKLLAELLGRGQWVYWNGPPVGAVVGWGIHKASTMEMK